MKREIAFVQQKHSPIIELDEFWTPAWETEAHEARLLVSNLQRSGARLHQALESFDD